jgi:hypothetical protein
MNEAAVVGEVAPPSPWSSPTEAAPSLVLSVPHFEVEATHDCSTPPRRSVCRLPRTRRAGTSRDSAGALAVQEPGSVLARFSATGFEAAAVTAMAVAAGGLPQPVGKALLVDLRRPFGFLAVHRPTGQPVVLGWITADQLVPHPAA